MNLDYKKVIKYPYYYVPPCPICGSKITGRMVKASSMKNFKWINLEALRNGELVASASENFHNNVFCAECGHTWHAPVTQYWLTKEQIIFEKEKRKTDPLLQQLLQEIEEEKKKKGFFQKILGL